MNLTKPDILKVILFAAVALLSGIARAQNMTAISGSNLMDLNGAKLAAGQICFLGTDNQNNPISFMVGGGGQALRRGYCASVTAGVISSFSVPNPGATQPSGIFYHVTVKDTQGSAAGPVLDYPYVSFTGATFNFDNYAPTSVSAGAPLSGNSVTGNLGVTGNVAATGTVTGSNIPGSILQQIFSSGVGQTQRTSFNMMAGLTCSDNAGTSRTDCRLGTLTTVAFSATPTFDASTASTFKLTLTGNVTSSTLSNAVAGEPLAFEICQDGVGGRTFVPPTNVQGWLTVSSTAGACSLEVFYFDGTNAQPDLLAGLTGDVTNSPGSTVTTVAKVNGVSFPSGPSTHAVPVVTAANTVTWKVLPDCTDVTGNHLNYTQSTDTWSCGTSGATVPGTGLVFNGSTSGTTTVKATATASGTLTLPAATDTLVARNTTDTLTLKSISGANNTLTLTPNNQRFTSNGTFTIPTGVTAVKVTVIGGGGAGGGATTTASLNGVGGGAGGAAIKWLTGLTPGNTLTVTVGTGGTGVANATGNAGTASTVASGTQTIATITGNAGNGGLVAGQPLGGGTGSGGDLNYSGNPGATGSSSNIGGNGGAGIFGGGGLAGLAGAGNAAVTSGSGGGGAGGSAGGTVAGGAGAGGIVIFEWVN